MQVCLPGCREDPLVGDADHSCSVDMADIPVPRSGVVRVRAWQHHQAGDQTDHRITISVVDGRGLIDTLPADLTAAAALALADILYDAVSSFLSGLQHCCP